MSVSSLASQHRAMGPHAGVERVRWMFAQRGAHFYNNDISSGIKSVASPQWNRTFHSPSLLGSGCVECQGNLKLEDRP